MTLRTHSTGNEAYSWFMNCGCDIHEISASPRYWAMVSSDTTGLYCPVRPSKWIYLNAFLASSRAKYGWPMVQPWICRSILQIPPSSSALTLYIPATKVLYFLRSMRGRTSLPVVESWRRHRFRANCKKMTRRHIVTSSGFLRLSSCSSSSTSSKSRSNSDEEWHAGEEEPTMAAVESTYPSLSRGRLSRWGYCLDSVIESVRDVRASAAQKKPPPSRRISD